MTFQELTDDFLDFEKDWFNQTIGGVQFWPIVRFALHAQIARRVFDLGKAHPGERKKKLSVFNRVKRNILGFKRRPGVVRGHRDVLFMLQPRLTNLDGKRARIMLDFFLPRLENSYAVLEMPLSNADSVTGQLPRVGPEDYIAEKSLSTTLSGIVNGLKWRFVIRPRTSREVARLGNVLSVALRERYGVDMNCVPILLNAMALYHKNYEPYKKILRRLDVKLLVTSVGYLAQTSIMTSVAHDCGIPVAELQHGLIDREHPGYNYPDGVHTSFMPDYLLSWGNSWASVISGFPRKKVFAVGYPYLQHFFRHRGDIGAGYDKTILFISQGTIGRELVSFALSLRKLLGMEYSIIYKLHPGEITDWGKSYPTLVDSGIDVADDPGKSVYYYFNRARYVVGVNSTALIEALRWTADVYLVTSFPISGMVMTFLQDGCFKATSSAGDFFRQIEKGGASGKTQSHGNTWALGDHEENMVEAIRRLVQLEDKVSR